MFIRAQVRKLTLIFALLLSVGLPPVQAKELEKVVASWLPIMQTTAYYVALEEGLFEEAGIEIVSTKLLTRWFPVRPILGLLGLRRVLPCWPNLASQAPSRSSVYKVVVSVWI